MRSKSIKTKILFVIFWTLLVVSFIFSAFLILLKANGYQLNYKNWKIVQTGMIILDGEPRSAQVTINGRKIGDLPVKLGNLSPGNFNVDIAADNYSPWQRIVRVEQGKAASFQNIILFLKDGKDILVPEAFTLDQLTQDSNRYSQDLKINGSEILLNDKLVSRFSQNVLTASLYPDEEHIIFQLEKEIRIVELDGGNNTLLFLLSSSKPTLIAFQDNGRSIIYLDQNKILGKTIR